MRKLSFATLLPHAALNFPQRRFWSHLRHSGVCAAFDFGCVLFSPFFMSGNGVDVLSLSGPHMR